MRVEAAQFSNRLAQEKPKLFDRILDRALNVTFIISASIFGFMMLLMVVHVMGRYLIAWPVPWAVEFSEYLLAIAIFLCAAWVLKEEAHVMIDVLVNYMRPERRNKVNAVTSWIIAAFLLFLTYWGSVVTAGHIMNGQVIWKTVLTPIWILDIFVPISTFLIFFQCLRRGRKFWLLSKNTGSPERVVEKEKE
jgi:C4-dicarboxylate transporter, DctQ subunit